MTNARTAVTESSEIDRDAFACPSAPCVEGASVLGVMTESSRLAYVQPAPRVDSAFAERARERGRPEARYRFTLPCAEAACPQWTGTRCAVADELVHAPTGGGNGPLPRCTIRRTCRWFAQHGADACAICPTVVADVGGVTTYQSERRLP